MNLRVNSFRRFKTMTKIQEEISKWTHTYPYNVDILTKMYRARNISVFYLYPKHSMLTRVRNKLKSICKNVKYNIPIRIIGYIELMLLFHHLFIFLKP